MKENSLRNSAGGNALIGKLSGNDDDKNETAALDLNSLVPYTNHPFKMYDGERLDDMVRSVKELGVIVPLIVRPIGKDKFEILSGHNRFNAAELAGLSEVPIIIKEGLSDEEARLIVTETNLVQRSFTDLSHSERAVALKTHMDAIKAQGKRTDIINEVNKLLNADKYGENNTCGLIGHNPSFSIAS